MIRVFISCFVHSESSTLIIRFCIIYLRSICELSHSSTIAWIFLRWDQRTVSEWTQFYQQFDIWCRLLFSVILSRICIPLFEKRMRSIASLKEWHNAMISKGDLSPTLPWELLLRSHCIILTWPGQSRGFVLNWTGPIDKLRLRDWGPYIPQMLVLIYMRI
jgi:hypothetical protein